MKGWVVLHVIACGIPVSPGIGGIMGGAVGRAGFVGRGVALAAVAANPLVELVAVELLRLPDFARIGSECRMSIQQHYIQVYLHYIWLQMCEG